MLAPKELFDLPDQPNNVYEDLLEDVIPEAPVINIPSLVSAELEGTCSQSKLVSLIWRTAGTMIHMPR